MVTQEQIDRFFHSPSFGVVGASNNREKYGNKVLRKYLERGMKAYPVNPKEPTVEGLASYAGVADLPVDVQSISIITPPAVTEQVVRDAIVKGIRNIWMQPGAESPRAIRACERHGINVIADGSCVLVILAQRK